MRRAVDGSRAMRESTVAARAATSGSDAESSRASRGAAPAPPIVDAAAASTDTFANAARTFNTSSQSLTGD